jgi:hypothetical protein
MRAVCNGGIALGGGRIGRAREKVGIPNYRPAEVVEIDRGAPQVGSVLAEAAADDSTVLGLCNDGATGCLRRLAFIES